MRLFLFIYLLLLSAFSFGQQHVQGYYVTLKGDTLSAQIPVLKSLFSGVATEKYYKGIDMSDSSGVFENKPADIRAFGFTYKSKDYKFYSKPVKNGSLLFMEIFATGPKTVIYQYIISSGGQYGSPEIGYTAEKQDGSFMYITNYASLGKFAEQFKTFYKGFPGAAEFIDKKFNGRGKIQKDMMSIADYINSL